MSAGLQNESDAVNDMQSISFLDIIEIDNVENATIWTTPGQEFFEYDTHLKPYIIHQTTNSIIKEWLDVYIINNWMFLKFCVHYV